MHKALALAAAQSIEHLLLPWRAKRYYAEYLCLSTGENGGAMRARQQSYFTTDGSYCLEIASIRAKAIVQDIVPAIRLQFLLIESADSFHTIHLLSPHHCSQLILNHT